jgi:hypothetical protein
VNGFIVVPDARETWSPSATHGQTDKKGIDFGESFPQTAVEIGGIGQNRWFTVAGGTCPERGTKRSTNKKADSEAPSLSI